MFGYLVFRIICIACFLFFQIPQIALAQEFKDVKFIKNYDGDTIYFDLGVNLPEFFRFTPLRLYGIDTPEVKSKHAAEKARALLVKEFVHDELTAAKKIDLTNCDKDKYFRILCRVSYDGKDLTNVLIDRGYGYAYFGEKKKIVGYK